MSCVARGPSRTKGYPGTNRSRRRGIDGRVGRQEEGSCQWVVVDPSWWVYDGSMVVVTVVAVVTVVTVVRSKDVERR